ncbi:MAG: GntR family transcriptional regulator [Anaerolineaceae bacterium]|nr:GntR family transcriptional regulator [Anaerolineaceae bacterium]
MSSEIDRNTPIPLYYQVAQVLRRQVETGELNPGEYIPTEKDLQLRFNVSRATVRQAINELVYAGILERQRSKGTLVARIPIEENVFGLASYTNELMKHDVNTMARQVDFALLPASAGVAQQLEVEAGHLLATGTRLRLVHKEPVAVERWFLPARLIPGYKKNFLKETGQEQSIYFMLWKHYGITIQRAIETVNATPLEPHDARLLNMTPGVPVLMRQRVSYTADGKVVMYSNGVYVSKLTIALEKNKTPSYQ